jgi:ATP-dependent RNA helicase DDX3X
VQQDQKREILDCHAQQLTPAALLFLPLQVGRVGSSTDLIAQHVEYVQQDQKRETVLDCVNTVEGLTLVFVETKRGADQLEDYLLRQNLPATSIHGDKSQAEREMVSTC